MLEPLPGSGQQVELRLLSEGGRRVAVPGPRLERRVELGDRATARFPERDGSHVRLGHEQTPQGSRRPRGVLQRVGRQPERQASARERRVERSPQLAVRPARAAIRGTGRFGVRVVAAPGPDRPVRAARVFRREADRDLPVLAVPDRVRRNVAEQVVRAGVGGDPPQAVGDVELAPHGEATGLMGDHVGSGRSPPVLRVMRAHDAGVVRLALGQLPPGARQPERRTELGRQADRHRLETRDVQEVDRRVRAAAGHLEAAVLGSARLVEEPRRDEHDRLAPRHARERGRPSSLAPRAARTRLAARS